MEVVSILVLEQTHQHCSQIDSAGESVHILSANVLGLKILLDVIGFTPTFLGLDV